LKRSQSKKAIDNPQQPEDVSAPNPSSTNENTNHLIFQNMDKQVWDNLTRSQRRNKVKKEKLKIKNEERRKGKNNRNLNDNNTSISSNTLSNKSLPEESITQEFNYPFEIDPQDHCETPQEAHQHLSYFLTYLAKEVLGKNISQLCIYDPFYCEGRVSTNFSKLGFTSVCNPCEDFYKTIQSETPLPDFDVIVTNPPYSGDHIEKVIEFCVSTSKPWFLLLPNFVYTKDYYQSVLIPEGKIVPQRVLYIVPERRYLFWTPKGRHQEKSKDKTSPFITFWYCYFGEKLADAFTWVSHQPKDKFLIAKETVDLPVNVLDQNDTRFKKIKNAQKRKNRT